MFGKSLARHCSIISGLVVTGLLLASHARAQIPLLPSIPGQRQMEALLQKQAMHEAQNFRAWLTHQMAQQHFAQQYAAMRSISLGQQTPTTQFASVWHKHHQSAMVNGTSLTPTQLLPVQSPVLQPKYLQASAPTRSSQPAQQNYLQRQESPALKSVLSPSTGIPSAGTQNSPPLQTWFAQQALLNRQSVSTSPQTSSNLGTWRTQQALLNRSPQPLTIGTTQNVLPRQPAVTANLPAAGLGQQIVNTAHARVEKGTADPGAPFTCADFVAWVLHQVGAKSTENFGVTGMNENLNYVWGNLVAQHKAGGSLSDFNGVLPGDVIQFRNVSSTSKTTLANGSFDSQTFSAPQHTAIVYQNLGGGRLVLLEQNFNGKAFVTQDIWNFSDMTSGTIWIYRPVAK